MEREDIMRVTEINDFVISATHCDWIIEQARELKALFQYESATMIEQNKIRALADIETIKNSLSELELHIRSI